MIFNTFPKELSPYGFFSKFKNTIQIRLAHKKVAGSRTHMQDSPGKRLGPKKHEGEAVKVGQIILRQRGTKWYPGVNVGIGRDHTLFASEPGFVRFYLDPFHPKRKFVGVALEKEDKLPYSHFDPTPRRFGRVILKGKEAEFEQEYLSRKETLLAPEVFKSLKEREEKRNSKKQTFAESIPKFVTGLSEEEIKLAAARLVKIDGFLRGGKSIDDARFYTTYNYNYDLSLKLKKDEISKEKLEQSKSQYQSLVSKVDSSIMFDARFNLTKNLTLEQIESKKSESFEGLKSLIPDTAKPISKDTKTKAIELIETAWFSLKEQLRLRRQFLKPVLPESPETLGTEKDKKVIAIQRMNIETRNVETIYRKKNAFLK